MKILISAIACEPLGGSEGAVGWQAVQQIAKHHDLRILVSASSRKSWIQAHEAGMVPPSIQVRFIGSDKPWHPNRFVARLQSWVRYIAFNRKLLQAAQDWYREEPFDLAHHLTYATWRVPSSLWKLPVPFVWGPIAGAAVFPRRFHPILSPSARLFETLRDISSFFGRRSRGFHECVKNSTVVIAANEETRRFLAPYRQDRPIFTLPVAFLSEEKIALFRRPPGVSRPKGPLRLFAGGNMIGSKGLALAVRALRQVKDAGIPFIYTIAGGGPEIPNIERLVKSLNLTNEVVFHPGFKGSEYIQALHESEIFLLPSFREALGITMIEAVLAGCYPVVLDSSMPGEIVAAAGGTAVAWSDIEATVSALAGALIDCSSNRANLENRSLEILEKITRLFTTERYVSVLNTAYNISEVDTSPSNDY